MRVFSTLMSWSNEKKSCMRVDKIYTNSNYIFHESERKLMRFDGQMRG